MDILNHRGQPLGADGRGCRPCAAVRGSLLADDASPDEVGALPEPPLARVGLSENEAKRRGIQVRVAKLPMSRVLRTEATEEKQGWMKVLVSASDDRVLGFTMIGADAGEVLAAIQLAMIAGLPYKQVRDAVITHLTYAEGLGPLFAGIPERP